VGDNSIRIRSTNGITIVKVDAWPRKSPDTTVSSCNVVECQLNEDRWPHPLVNSVRSRLANNDGKAKGRVLYALETLLFPTRTEAFGLLTYHIDPRRGLQVMQVGTATDVYRESRQVAMIGLLLECAQAIATKAGIKAGRIEWILPNGTMLNEACDIYGFERKLLKLPIGRVAVRRPI
jgi:hypothetical protein